MARSLSKVRAEAGRLGAHTRWAKDPHRTQPLEAHRVFMDRFEREVDPEGKLDPQTRAKLAENARKAYFLRLAMLSAKARRSKKAALGGDPDA